ncbi:ee4ffc4e-32ea-48b5-aa49-ec14d1d607e8 [Sclerotinia trifoliorum]|uniref:Ee4ffc4e-32ea-48b5-aa49-ec14d1d607e8 n=1 Tax=Sclerotinia trifoliorum TaxID=28548 RepID=A0A8H2ZPL7_9HELO|nr:ee4ffc4e-32ea-48b5-aa49-ec14d1d607e8 [Sclerotinia trifoliorum]
MEGQNNHRGGKAIQMIQGAQSIENKLAIRQKRSSAQQKKQLNEQKDTQQSIDVETEMKKRALEFDFSTLRQHPVLTIKKTNDNVQMIIDLDFFQSESAPGIRDLIEVLTDYAALISNVKILIKAPKYHFNTATYNGRAENISRVISKLNTFNLTQVEVIACLNSHNSFEQLKLAAAAYDLRLCDWTLAYELCGCKGKWEVQIDSLYERKLRGVYRKEFLKEHWC